MIKVIDSIDNPTIKMVNKLNQKKHIVTQGACFVEGKKIVEDLLKNHYPIHTIFVKQDMLQEFINQNSLGSINITAVSSRVNNKLSETITGNGIYALVNLPQPTNFDTNSNFIVLDGVQDPTNLGAIIRSALAFGFKQIILLNSVYPYLPKVIRASMGYVFGVNFYDLTFAEFENLIKQNNLKLYTATMQGKTLHTMKPQKPFGFVVGNEGNGVSDDVTRLCTDSISIPMQNNVESLNVAVSASIIMHQLAK